MICGLGDRTLGDSEAFGAGFQFGDGIGNTFEDNDLSNQGGFGACNSDLV